MHRLTLWGQWAVQLMQCTPTLPGGGGQWNSCNARAHELGDGESCPVAVAAQTVELVHALPHYLGAVGSGLLAMRGPTSWGHGGACPGGGRCLKSGARAMHRLTT